MGQTQQHVTLGPFRLVRPLGVCGLGERWVALHERARSNHALYRLPRCRDNAERRRVIQAIEHVASVSHPHLLGVEQFSFGDDGRPWVVTPYVGTQDGLITLKDLIKAKGGRMIPAEAERTCEQLLSAIGASHHAGRHHGQLSTTDVLVDRRGSLAIELYGLQRELDGFERGNAELIRDEVRAIVELGYSLVTGLSAEDPRIRASRLVKKLDKAWDAWFDAGLDPLEGFATASEAIEAMPTVQAMRAADEPASTAVRTVLRRLRSGPAARAGER